MSGVSCRVCRGVVESKRGFVPLPVYDFSQADCDDLGPVLNDNELDADYFAKVYTDLFGLEKSRCGPLNTFPLVPYPNAQSTEQRISNIEAIEKDIEERFDVTLSHIPPGHIINGVSTAVEDLNEILETIDVAERENKGPFEELSVADLQNGKWTDMCCLFIHLCSA